MKLKFVLFTFLLVQQMALATPLSTMLADGPIIKQNLETAYNSLNSQITKLERQVRNGNYRLNPSVLGPILVEVEKARSLVQTASLRGFAIRNEFSSAARFRPADDRFDSISSLLSGLESKLRFEMTSAIQFLNAEQLLGALKEVRFGIADTAGNMMIALADAAELNKPYGSQIDRSQKLFSSFSELFQASSKKIMTAKVGRGDRTISYVSGTTMGFVSNLGPSNLTAEEAYIIESRRMKDLRETLNKLEKSQPVKAWLSVVVCTKVSQAK